MMPRYYIRGMGLALATPVMPPLLPSACAASQRYIPPGGSMGPGWGNMITGTGACVDAGGAGPDAAAAASSSGLSSIPWWGWALAAVGVFMVVK
jgi:hypothetical protein